MTSPTPSPASATATAPAAPPSLDNAHDQTMLWRLRACSFAQIAGFGAMMPVQNVWMADHGLSKTAIGCLMAIGTAVQFAGGLWLGNLADRSAKPHRLQMLGCLVYALGLAVFAFADRFLGFAGYMVLRGLGLGAMYAVMPLLVTSVLGKNKAGFGYASYRIFGSVGWITGTIGLTMLTDDLRYLIVAAAGFMLLSPWPLLGYQGQPQPKREHVPVWKAFHNPTLLPVYVGVFFMAMGVPSIFEFLPQFAKETFGAPTAFLGMLSGINGVIALVALPAVGWLVDKTGPKRWLVFALICLPLRSVFTGLVPHFTDDHRWLLLPQGLHFFTWTGLEIAGVLYVAKHAQPGNRGMATAAFYGAQVIGQFLGALLCGGLSEALGFEAMYGWIASISALGPISFYLLHRRPRKKQAVACL